MCHLSVSVSVSASLSVCLAPSLCLSVSVSVSLSVSPSPAALLVRPHSRNKCISTVCPLPSPNHPSHPCTFAPIASSHPLHPSTHPPAVKGRVLHIALSTAALYGDDGLVGASPFARAGCWLHAGSTGHACAGQAGGGRGEEGCCVLGGDVTNGSRWKRRRGEEEVTFFASQHSLHLHSHVLACAICCDPRFVLQVCLLISLPTFRRKQRGIPSTRPLRTTFIAGASQTTACCPWTRSAFCTESGPESELESELERVRVRT